MHLCDHQCEDKLVNNSDVVIKDMNKKWAFSSYKCFYSNLFQQQEHNVRFILSVYIQITQSEFSECVIKDAIPHRLQNSLFTL